MGTTFLAHVEASSEYLEFLANAFPSGKIRMTQSDRGPALQLEMEQDGLDTTDAWNESEFVVNSVLAALNVFSNRIGPIKVAAPVSAIDATGRGRTMGTPWGIAIRIVSHEGLNRLLETTSCSSESLAARIVMLARENKQVARALSIIGDRDPSWADIYLLMELVEVSLSRQSHRKGKDWVSIKAERWLPGGVAGRLKQNAAYHRHAKQYDPPTPLMPLSDAQRYCKQVVAKWLERLCSTLSAR